MFGETIALLRETPLMLPDILSRYESWQDSISDFYDAPWLAVTSALAKG